MADASDARFDLTAPRAVHLVGAGGAGMSAIATVLAAMGHAVTGSDLKESASVDRLRAADVEITIGHRAGNVGAVDAVAVSTAVPAHNPEVRAATERGIPVLRRAEVLAAICRTRRTLAVAGTHGKTTTSSMLALVLVEAGLEPSFIVGGDVNEIGSGAAWGAGEWLVVEADESDGTFVDLGADGVVVTNVEPDHLEHYGGWEPLRAAFERFVADAEGPRVVCSDDAHAAAIAAEHGATTYGTSSGAHYRMTDVALGPDGSTFALTVDGAAVVSLALPVPGLHNARNAAAAAVTGHLLGAPWDAVAAALGRFAGVARRYEHRGTEAGVTFVDEYSHLPTEVAAALATARLAEPSRLIAVFQPHRFSRTESLHADFADAFTDADLVVVTDVYPAGEPPRPGVSGLLVVRSVLDAHPRARVAYLPRLDDVATYLAGELRGGDLCLTLGAGDLTSVPDVVQRALRERAES